MAASRVLPIVMQAIDVRSVIDVGCGTGRWLSAARGLGISDLTGVEGPWARAWFNEEKTGIAGDDFELIIQDLEDELALGRTYDLAISVEVAEHLPPARGPSFVRDLCRLSRRVLFSAAIPGQGGINHQNEQWTTWWSAQFGRHGFKALDLIRPQIWNEKTIPVWYRQNVVLFVHEEEREAVSGRMAAESARQCQQLIDIVHPELFIDRVDVSVPNLRNRVRLTLGIPGLVLRRMRRRI
jgi:SAM-dependent methyltransferase